jgi:hypothetical protein
MAVSTAGKSPAFAKHIRKRLEDQFGPEYGELLDLMGAIRTRLLAEAHEPEAHKPLFEQLIAENLLDLVKKKIRNHIDRLLEKVLGSRLPIRPADAFQPTARGVIWSLFSSLRPSFTCSAVPAISAIFFSRNRPSADSRWPDDGWICPAHDFTGGLRHSGGQFPGQQPPRDPVGHRLGHRRRVSGLFRSNKSQNTGFYAAPLVSLTMIAAYQMPKPVAENPQLFKSWWLAAHIITIFLGNAAFALACGLGMLYLLQENAIKRKTRGFFFSRLPSLDLLDTTGYACIVVGFTMISIGLITGVVYAKAVWGRFWSWDPKEVWSVITWLFTRPCFTSG